MRTATFKITADTKSALDAIAALKKELASLDKPVAGKQVSSGGDAQAKSAQKTTAAFEKQKKAIAEVKKEMDSLRKSVSAPINITIGKIDGSGLQSLKNSIAEIRAQIQGLGELGNPFSSLSGEGLTIALSAMKRKIEKSKQSIQDSLVFQVTLEFDESKFEALFANLRSKIQDLAAELSEAFNGAARTSSTQTKSKAEPASEKPKAKAEAQVNIKGAQQKLKTEVSAFQPFFITVNARAKDLRESINKHVKDFDFTRIPLKANYYSLYESIDEIIKRFSDREVQLKVTVDTKALLQSIKDATSAVQKEKIQLNFEGRVKVTEAEIAPDVKTISESKNVIGTGTGSGQDIKTKGAEIKPKASDQSAVTRAVQASTEATNKSMEKLSESGKAVVRAMQQASKIQGDVATASKDINIGQMINKDSLAAGVREAVEIARIEAESLMGDIPSFYAEDATYTDQSYHQLADQLGRLSRALVQAAEDYELFNSAQSNASFGDRAVQQEVLGGRIDKIGKDTQRGVSKISQISVGTAAMGTTKEYEALEMAYRNLARTIEQQSAKIKASLDGVVDSKGYSNLLTASSKVQGLMQTIDTSITSTTPNSATASGGDTEVATLRATEKAVEELVNTYAELGRVRDQAVATGDEGLAGAADQGLQDIGIKLEALIKRAFDKGKTSLAEGLQDVTRGEAGSAISRVQRSGIQKQSSAALGSVLGGDLRQAGERSKDALANYNEISKSISRIIERMSNMNMLTKREQKDLDGLRMTFRIMENDAGLNKVIVSAAEQMQALQDRTQQTKELMKSIGSEVSDLTSLEDPTTEEASVTQESISNMIKMLEKEASALRSEQQRLERTIAKIGKSSQTEQLVKDLRSQTASIQIQIKKYQESMQSFNSDKSKRMGFAGSDENRYDWSRGGGEDALNKNIQKTANYIANIDKVLNSLGNKSIFREADLDMASQLNTLITGARSGLSEMQSSYGVLQGRASQEGPDGDAARARLEKVNPEYEKVTKQLTERTRKTEALNERMKDYVTINKQAVKGLDGFSASLAKGIINNTIFASSFAFIFGVQNAIRNSIKDFIELQKEAARVVTVAESVSTTNKELAKQVGDAMVQASKDFGVSYRDASAILKEFGAAGIDAETALRAFDSTMRTVIATEADSKAVTRAVAAIYEVMADSINSVGGAFDKMNRINDVMVRAFKDSQMDLQELTQGFRFASASARNVGLGFEDLTALLGVLNNNFIKSGQAGRSLQTTFSQIAQKGPAFAKAFNVEYDDSKPLDFIDLLRQVSGQMRSTALTAQEVERVFRIFGLEGARSFIVLAQNFESVKDQMESIRLTADGATTSASGIATETLGTRLEALKRTFQTGMTGFLQSITGDDEAFANLASVVETFTKAVEAFFKIISNNSGTIGAVVGWFVRLSAALVALSIARLVGTSFLILGRTLLTAAKSGGIATTAMSTLTWVQVKMGVVNKRTTAYIAAQSVAQLAAAKTAGAAAAGTTVFATATAGLATAVGFLMGTLLPMVAVLGAVWFAFKGMGTAAGLRDKSLAKTISTLQQERQELLQNIKTYAVVVRDLEKIEKLQNTSMNSAEAGMAARKVVDQYSASIKALGNAQAYTNEQLAEGIGRLRQMVELERAVEIASEKQNRERINEAVISGRPGVARTGDFKKDMDRDLEDYGIVSLLEIGMENLQRMSQEERDSLQKIFVEHYKTLVQNTGGIEEANKLLAEVIGTDALKELTGLGSGDEIVRAIFGRDPEVLLNIGVVIDDAAIQRGGDSIGRTLNSKMMDAFRPVSSIFASTDLSEFGGRGMPDTVRAFRKEFEGASGAIRDVASVFKEIETSFENMTEADLTRLIGELERAATYTVSSRVSTGVGNWTREATEQEIKGQESVRRAILQSIDVLKEQRDAMRETDAEASKLADRFVFFGKGLGSYERSLTRTSVVLSTLTTDVFPAFNATVQRGMREFDTLRRMWGDDEIVNKAEAELLKLSTRYVQAGEELIKIFKPTNDAQVYLNQLRTLSDEFEKISQSGRTARETIREFYASDVGQMETSRGRNEETLVRSIGIDRTIGTDILNTLDLEDSLRKELEDGLKGADWKAGARRIVDMLSEVSDGEIPGFYKNIESSLVTSIQESITREIKAAQGEAFQFDNLFDGSEFDGVMEVYQEVAERIAELGPDMESTIITPVEILTRNLEQTVQAMSYQMDGDVSRLQEAAGNVFDETVKRFPELVDEIKEVFNSMGGVEGVNSQSEFGELFGALAGIDGIDMNLLLNSLSQAIASAREGENATSENIAATAATIRESFDRGFTEMVSSMAMSTEALQASLRDLSTSLNQKDALRERRAEARHERDRLKIILGDVFKDHREVLKAVFDINSVDQLSKAIETVAEMDAQGLSEQGRDDQANALVSLQTQLATTVQQYREVNKEITLNLKNEYNILSNQLSSFIESLLDYRITVFDRISEELGLIQQLEDFEVRAKLAWEAISRDDGDSIEMEKALLKIEQDRLGIVSKMYELQVKTSASRQQEIKALASARFSSVTQLDTIFAVRNAMLEIDKIGNELNILEAQRAAHGVQQGHTLVKEQELRTAIAENLATLKSSSLELLKIEEETNKVIDKRLEIVKQMGEIIKNELQNTAESLSSAMDRNLRDSVVRFGNSLKNVFGTGAFIPENTIERVVVLAGKMPQHFKSTNKYVSDLVNRLTRLQELNTRNERVQVSLMGQRERMLRAQLKSYSEMGDLDGTDRALTGLMSLYSELAQFSPTIAFEGLSELDSYMQGMGEDLFKNNVNDLREVMNIFDLSVDKLLQFMTYATETADRRLGDIQGDGGLDLTASAEAVRGSASIYAREIEKSIKVAMKVGSEDLADSLTLRMSQGFGSPYGGGAGTPPMVDFLMRQRDASPGRELRRMVEGGVTSQFRGSLDSFSRSVSKMDTITGMFSNLSSMAPISLGAGDITGGRIYRGTSVEGAADYNGAGRVVGDAIDTSADYLGYTLLDSGEQVQEIFSSAGGRFILNMGQELEYRGRQISGFLGAETYTSKLGLFGVQGTGGRTEDSSASDNAADTERIFADMQRTKVDDIIKQFYERDIKSTLNDALSQFEELSQDFTKTLGVRLGGAISSFFTENVVTQVRGALDSVTGMFDSILFSWVDIFNQIGKSNEQMSEQMMGEDQLAALQKRLRRNEISYMDYLNAIEDMTEQAQVAGDPTDDEQDVAGQLIRNVGKGISGASGEFLKSLSNATKDFTAGEISNSLLMRMVLGEGTKEARISYIRSELEALNAELEGVGISGGVDLSESGIVKQIKEISEAGRSALDVDRIMSALPVVDNTVAGMDGASEAIDRAGSTLSSSSVTAADSIVSGSDRAGRRIVESAETAASIIARAESGMGGTGSGGGGRPVSVSTGGGSTGRRASGGDSGGSSDAEENKKVGQAIGQAANVMLSASKMLVGGIMQMASMDFGEIADEFLDMLSDLPEQISEVMTELIERLPELFETLAEVIPEIVTSLFENLPQLVDVIMEGLMILLPELLKQIPMIVQGMLQAVVSILSNLSGLLKGILEGLVEMLPDLIMNLMGSVGDIIASLIGQLPMIVLEIVKAIPKMIAAIFKGLFKGIGNFFKGIGKLFKKKKDKTDEEREAEFDAAISEMDNIGDVFPKFHSGGMVTGTHRAYDMSGLGTDEVPAILQIGEAVLTNKAVRALGGAQVVKALNGGAMAPSMYANSVPNDSITDFMERSMMRLMYKGAKLDSFFHSGGLISDEVKGAGAMLGLETIGADLSNLDLLPDEVPVVLKVGEGILTSKGLYNLGGPAMLEVANSPEVSDIKKVALMEKMSAGYELGNMASQNRKIMGFSTIRGEKTSAIINKLENQPEWSNIIKEMMSRRSQLKLSPDLVDILSPADRGTKKMKGRTRASQALYNLFFKNRQLQGHQETYRLKDGDPLTQMSAGAVSIGKEFKTQITNATKSKDLMGAALQGRQKRRREVLETLKGFKYISEGMVDRLSTGGDIKSFAIGRMSNVIGEQSVGQNSGSVLSQLVQESIQNRVEEAGDVHVKSNAEVRADGRLDNSIKAATKLVDAFKSKNMSKNIPTGGIPKFHSGGVVGGTPGAGGALIDIMKNGANPHSKYGAMTTNYIAPKTVATDSSTHRMFTTNNNTSKNMSNNSNFNFNSTINVVGGGAEASSMQAVIRAEVEKGIQSFVDSVRLNNSDNAKFFRD